MSVFLDDRVRFEGSYFDLRARMSIISSAQAHEGTVVAVEQPQPFGPDHPTVHVQLDPTRNRPRGTTVAVKYHKVQRLTNAAAERLAGRARVSP